MTLREFKKATRYSYSKLVRKLKRKYGKINKKQYYFVVKRRFLFRKLTPQKNDKLYKDGLFLHHTAEIVETDLSNYNKAITLPKKLQSGKFLVYCDYLEHALLHIKIVESKPNKMKKYYINGLISYLIPELNHFYAHGIYEYKKGTQQRLRPFYKRIVDDYDTYVSLVAYVLDLMDYCHLFNDPDIMLKGKNRSVSIEDILCYTNNETRDDILKKYRRF